MIPLTLPTASKPTTNLMNWKPEALKSFSLTRDATFEPFIARAANTLLAILKDSEDVHIMLEDDHIEERGRLISLLRKPFLTRDNSMPRSKSLTRDKRINFYETNSYVIS